MISGDLNSGLPPTHIEQSLRRAAWAESEVAPAHSLDVGDEFVASDEPLGRRERLHLEAVSDALARICRTTLLCTMSCH